MGAKGIAQCIQTTKAGAQRITTQLVWGKPCGCMKQTSTLCLLGFAYLKGYHWKKHLTNGCHVPFNPLVLFLT